MTNTNDEKFRQLREGYLRQSLSAEELSAFLALVNQPEYQRLLTEGLDNDLYQERFKGLTSPLQVTTAFQNVADKIRDTGMQQNETGMQGSTIVKMARRQWNRVAAAAILILLMGATGVYLMTRTRELGKGPTGGHYAVQTDMAPGGNKAVLILGDGSKIVLDNASNGSIADQAGTKVVKTDQGQLAYRAGNSEEVVYNTVATPKSGQYRIQLPDGSEVWLNSVSSIRFPTAFTGSERVVEIEGEAYFEVKHQTKMPFKVKVKNMMVEVLGTHFNINAYTNEAIVRTTLLEGSVRVSKGATSSLLAPGQQAQVDQHGSGVHVVNDVDTDQAIAWKNGFFNFDEADIGTIMRQIARWYDVDVDYSRVRTKELFWGGMERNLPLPEVLKILEKNNIHFQIDGQKITAFD